MRSRLAGPSFFTSRPTPSDVYGMLPSDRTSPLGSATPTTSLSESTSSPTCRISFSIDRLLSLVALRYGQADRSVTYELAIGAGRPIVTIPPIHRKASELALPRTVLLHSDVSPHSGEGNAAARRAPRLFSLSVSRTGAGASTSPRGPAVAGQGARACGCASPGPGA